MASPSMPLMPVTSGSDLVSSAPADLFEGIENISATGAEDVPEDVPVDEPVPDEEPADDVDETPADDAEAAPDDQVEPTPDTAAEPAVEEELPEGVIKTKDASGKYKYRLEESRYKTVYGNHQLVQQASEIIGEPLTVDGLRLRNEALVVQERLYSALESGDPASQGEAVKFMLDEMTAARDGGEVGVDPTVPFAEAVYTNLRDHAPDAYANLRLMAARDLIGEMFENAAQSNNPQLFSAMQHLSAALVNAGAKPANMTPEQYISRVREITGKHGVPFFTPEEMQGLAKGEDPIKALNQQVADLKSQLNGRTETSSAEQLQNWDRTHTQAVNTAVMNDAVKPALASVEAGWEKFPDEYSRLVVDPLNREVSKAIKEDTAFNEQIKTLRIRAGRAVSEQVRDSLGAQIQQLYVNRAKFAAEKAKGPILKFAANALKGLSDTTHERRNGAQGRTAPKGPSAPVKTSLLPPDLGMKGDIFDPKVAVQQAVQLLGAGGR